MKCFMGLQKSFFYLAMKYFPITSTKNFHPYHKKIEKCLKQMKYATNIYPLKLSQE
jgi:hypothetical protein